METTIVVRASAAMIVWLSPKLGAFQDEYPGVGIKLVTSLWQNDLEKHPVDVDILLASQNQSDQRMTKLSDERIVPVCGKQTSTKILSPADLMKCDTIHILGFDDHWSRYLSANGLPTDIISPQLVVDTSVAACELVAAENGCAIMLERFAQQAIKAGRPIRIVGDPVINGQSHYVVQRNTTPPVQHLSSAFCGWLKTCF
ncbi:LysR substrate-binding domain-containing protein [uncultured Shimia sp.]|uniref:LysR substrate-binding domain-containing protein n=1 Tax=uncultured Shimia sp. TaxID=573152 RepID=UPI002627A6C7|nr:LysR substrate-binding domain-containing protein [uncultured Shimia sp.]